MSVKLQVLSAVGVPCELCSLLHARKRTSDIILYIPEETYVNNTNLLCPQIPLEYSGIC